MPETIEIMNDEVAVLRKYEQSKISISKAAEDTGLTIGEIEEYMVREGYRSKYSLADLKRELEILDG